MEAGRRDTRLPAVRTVDVDVYRQTRSQFPWTRHPADRRVDRQWLEHQIASSVTWLHESRGRRTRLGYRRRPICFDLDMGRFRGAEPQFAADQPDLGARRGWWSDTAGDPAANRARDTYGDFITESNANADTDTDTDTDTDSNRDRKAYTGGNAPACCDGTASQANAEAGAARQYLRRPGQSVGLQLLWRQRHLKPTGQLLRLLQLHSFFLEQHEWICRAVC